MSALTLCFMGCDDRLEDLNTDKRNPSEVAPSSLFTQGLRETSDMMVSINVNENPFNLYAQYWAQTTYPDESQYNQTGRSIPESFWINGYRDALIDFKEAKTLIQEDLEGASETDQVVYQNQIAAIDIISSYVYLTMVDAFGNIPYSEALNPDKLNPAYDDARTVYESAIATLKSATEQIDEGAAGFAASQDPLYGGDMTQWKLFANSLRLRYGMRLADVASDVSKTVVNDAIASGVFSSNADNATLTYYGAAPNTNPIYEDLVLSGRADFVAANTIVDIMNELDDPRRPVYFRENLGAGVFDGGVYGDANSYAGYTQVGDILHTAEFPGIIMTYAEVELLKAEAAERGGYNVSGTAAAHYLNGIEASMEFWDLPMSEYNAYVVQPEVAYTGTNGGGLSKAEKQQIGVQLWLAQYSQGFEGWTTWRRLDFEGFTPPPGMSAGDIPLRLLYPLSEGQLNNTNYEAAGTAIGGDLKTTPIFWDVN